jgi:hypothetical protein
MGKRWGKNIQKSSKKYTNVRETIPRVFLDKSSKTIEITKVHKPVG